MATRKKVKKRANKKAFKSGVLNVKAINAQNTMQRGGIRLG